MKKSVLAVSVALTLFAAPALAFAGDLNSESKTLPDGSRYVVITGKEGAFMAPGSASVARFFCSAPPTVKCTMVGSDVEFQDGLLSGLPGDIVRAVGMEKFGRALRPATSETYNSNYSETGVGVTTDSGDVNTNNSGNDYDFDDEDDGKG